MKLSLLHLFILLVHVCSASVLQTGKGKEFSSIRSALSAARSGDTIMVQPGIYREKNLIIAKQVTLIGINNPVIDGENKNEILSVKANAVVVKGFRIINSGYATLEDPAGIKIYDSRYVRIENNIIENTFFGIYTQYSTGCVIKNNRLKSNGKMEQEIGNGIHCWKSDSMTISGNVISGHRDGIYFEFVTNSSITGNYAYQNIRYGLHFMFSHNDTYVKNTFKNNGAGVAVMFTRKVKMRENKFQNNWGDAAFGLLLKEISDSEIRENSFEGNTTGILMEGASRVDVSKNNFTSNGWAMKIQASCMDVIVKQNNFFGNSFDVATNGTLMLNNFNGNYWDKYEGYDLNKDQHGDIPYRPISLFSMIVENNPQTMMLFRSILIAVLDKTEKIIPTLTPENLKDETPLMKPVKL